MILVQYDHNINFPTNLHAFSIPDHRNCYPIQSSEHSIDVARNIFMIISSLTSAIALRVHSIYARANLTHIVMALREVLQVYDETDRKRPIKPFGEVRETGDSGEQQNSVGWRLRRQWKGV